MHPYAAAGLAVPIAAFAAFELAIGEYVAGIIFLCILILWAAVHRHGRRFRSTEAERWTM